MKLKPTLQKLQISRLYCLWTVQNQLHKYSAFIFCHCQCCLTQWRAPVCLLIHHCVFLSNVPSSNPSPLLSVSSLNSYYLFFLSAITICTKIHKMCKTNEITIIHVKPFNKFYFTSELCVACQLQFANPWSME